MQWLLIICLLYVLAGQCVKSAFVPQLQCPQGMKLNGATCVFVEDLEESKKYNVSMEEDETSKELSNVDAECLPRSKWESNCHSCECSESGAAKCVKQKDCLDEHVLAEPIRCKPNTTFNKGCNTCLCLENGLGLCTLQNCWRSSIPKKSELLPGKDCAPGSSWRSQCNDCVCNDQGISLCTLALCPDQEQEPIMNCAPNTMWKNDCNTCWCTTAGKAMCTRIGCISINSFGEEEKNSQTKFIANTVTRSSKNVTKSVVCVANRMFIKDCNTCWCNDDGTSFYCTRRVCASMLPDEIETEDPEKLREVKKQCKPDEVFELDCNMCRCNPDGKSFSCTRRACVEEDKKNKSLSRKVRALQQTELPKACQPGQEFRMDCNKCLCDNEGQNFSCTRIDCSAVNNNHEADAFSSARTKREVTKQETKKCVPGSVFDQGCNVCRCTDEGYHATCTLKRCHQENEVDVHAPEQDPGFRCNAGEQFTRDCNDCTCSADGKSIFCTIRLCDQDLTPDI